MRNLLRRLERAGSSSDRSGIGLGSRKVYHRAGQADRLTGTLSVVDFESALRKSLPCSRRKITEGKRGKSGIALVAVLQVQHFSAALATCSVQATWSYWIATRKVLASVTQGRALEGSDSHNSSQLCVGFRPRAAAH